MTGETNPGEAKIVLIAWDRSSGTSEALVIGPFDEPDDAREWANHRLNMPEGLEVDSMATIIMRPEDWP